MNAADDAERWHKVLSDLLTAVDNGFRHQGEVNRASRAVNDSTFKYAEHLDTYVRLLERQVAELGDRVTALESTRGRVVGHDLGSPNVH